jgi:hypothetical protein
MREHEWNDYRDTAGAPYKFRKRSFDRNFSLRGSRDLTEHEEGLAELLNAFRFRQMQHSELATSVRFPHSRSG